MIMKEFTENELKSAAVITVDRVTYLALPLTKDVPSIQTIMGDFNFNIEDDPDITNQIKSILLEKADKAISILSPIMEYYNDNVREVYQEYLNDKVRQNSTLIRVLTKDLTSEDEQIKKYAKDKINELKADRKTLDIESSIELSKKFSKANREFKQYLSSFDTYPLSRLGLWQYDKRKSFIKFSQLYNELLDSETILNFVDTVDDLEIKKIIKNSNQFRKAKISELKKYYQLISTSGGEFVW